jgi:hypothetical protein
MEELVEIISLDSCIAIYSYLMLFGKTTPARLREVTGQSKATMFRNLARLSQVGVLQKEDIESVEDRRYSTHYYISKNLVDLAKGLYSSKLSDFARSAGKSNLVGEWLAQVEALPYSLHQHTSRLILIAAQRSLAGDGTPCNAVSKFLSFRLTDLEEVGTLHKKLQSVVEYIDQNDTATKRDFKRPLKSPVAISISVVALNPKGLPRDSGTIVEVQEC